MENLLLSNINITTIAKRLEKKYNVAVGEGYDNWASYFWDSKNWFPKELKRIFLFFDGESLLNCFPEKNQIKELYDVILTCAANNPGIRFYINTVDMSGIQTICLDEQWKQKEFAYMVNQEVYSCYGKVENIYIFDLEGMVRQTGAGLFYSHKMWYLASCKFSMLGEKQMAEMIKFLIGNEKKVRKKCVILDLDNTLWGGVIGEVGQNGIDLSRFKEGSRYYDFQKQFLRMKEKGILLAICSKNNLQDALEGLRHPDMVLRETDFVSIKANWEPKSGNILEIAKELNIGLDSIVFVDDNPVEREEVKTVLPEVCCPDFPEDTACLEEFANQLYLKYFYMDKTSEEDRQKTQMYQQNALREDLKRKLGNIEDFIKDLKIRIMVQEAKGENISRIAQLTQKTNQFNLTGNRYNEAEILELIHGDNTDVFFGEVADRIGNNGICLVCILRYTDTEALIDTFLMSCRVMGKQIEYYFMDYIIHSMKKRGIKKIIGIYKKTEKNMPCQEFLLKSGFSLLNGRHILILDEYETNIVKSLMEVTAK